MFGLGGATLVASLWIYNAGTLTLTIFVHTKMDLEVDICTFVGAAAWCGRGGQGKELQDTGTHDFLCIFSNQC